MNADISAKVTLQSGTAITFTLRKGTGPPRVQVPYPAGSFTVIFRHGALEGVTPKSQWAHFNLLFFTITNPLDTSWRNGRQERLTVAAEHSSVTGTGPYSCKVVSSHFAALKRNPHVKKDGPPQSPHAAHLHYHFIIINFFLLHNLQLKSIYWFKFKASSVYPWDSETLTQFERQSHEWFYIHQTFHQELGEINRWVKRESCELLLLQRLLCRRADRCPLVSDGRLAPGPNLTDSKICRCSKPLPKMAQY